TPVQAPGTCLSTGVIRATVVACSYSSPVAFKRTAGRLPMCGARPIFLGVSHGTRTQAIPDRTDLDCADAGGGDDRRRLDAGGAAGRFPAAAGAILPAPRARPGHPLHTAGEVVQRRQ